jgi:hypothetical protein
LLNSVGEQVSFSLVCDLESRSKTEGERRKNFDGDNDQQVTLEFFFASYMLLLLLVVVTLHSHSSCC